MKRLCRLPTALVCLLLGGCAATPTEPPDCPTQAETAQRVQLYLALSPIPNPPETLTLAADTSEAARLAKERALREGMSVLALGGLFLSAEIQRAWNGGDPTSLEFL